jgi:superfamily II DNA or RNA helicase
MHLEVEVDFEHHRGVVTLFFFEVEGKNRRPARIQRLYNLTEQCRRSKNGLPATDSELLIKLAPNLSKPGLLKKNLLAIPLTKAQWNKLKDHFKDSPRRFLDRTTGTAINNEIPVCPLFFELTTRSDQTYLSAVVNLPDGNVQHWPRVQGNIQQENIPGRSDPVIRADIHGKLIELDLPIGLEILNTIFGQDNLQVPSEKVAEHLPALINFRFDRLRGNGVIRETRNVEAGIKLRTEGADIILDPRAGSFRLRIGAATGTQFTRNGSKFLLIEQQIKGLDVILTFLKKLDWEQREDGCYKVKAIAKNGAKLIPAIKAVSKNFPMEIAKELQPLLDPPKPVHMQMDARRGLGWFELKLQFSVGKVPLDTEAVRESILEAEGVARLTSGEWLRLDMRDAASALTVLNEFDQGRLRGPTFAASGALDKFDNIPNLRLHRTAKQLARDLANMSSPGDMPIRRKLASQLRPYQKTGAEFLFNRCSYNVGSLLADDMGLGKTLQVLTCIEGLKRADRLENDALVICPASVLHVWKTEVERFFPSLKPVVVSGTVDQRHKILAEEKADIWLLSYSIARNDLDILEDRGFDVVVVDEAQQIRNPKALITQAVKRLDAPMRIALSGTPLENRLTDLWSISDFLNPGYLGFQKTFEALYTTPRSRVHLRRRIEPVMLRRKKEEVAPELPPRIEETLLVPMGDEQQRYYNSLLAKARGNLQGKSQMAILAALTRLRQCCCDPRLLKKQGVPSAKLDNLLELLDSILSEGHSVLVFSQFTTMLDLIAPALEEQQIKHFMLTGKDKVDDRAKLVEQFNSEEDPSVFLLSLKAAGTGLTLTKADYVVLFDPWWNPAVEQQAIDRAHRIGQDRAVVAYRMVMADTVEEKVLHLQESKRELFEETIEGAAGSSSSKLSAKELAALLDA